MAKKYKEQNESSLQLHEPAAAYYRSEPAVKPTGWNPNVPFIGTQEEWWEHFHAIERGRFKPVEESNAEFEAWKKAFLASKL